MSIFTRQYKFMILIIGLLLLTHVPVMAQDQQKQADDISETNLQGGFKSYTFSLNRGETLTVLLDSATNGDVDGGVIYDPSGNQIQNFSAPSIFSSGGPVSVMAETTGQYEVDVEWSTFTYATHEERVCDNYSGACNNENVDVQVNNIVSYVLHYRIDSALPPLEQARAFIDNGSYSAAESLLQELLTNDPKNAQAVDLLGLSSQYQSNRSSALENYSKAHDLDPNNPAFLADMASAYFELTQYSDAMTAIEKAIALSPDAVSYRQKGVYHMIQNEFRDAIDAFGESIRIDTSGSNFSYFWRAVAYSANGDYELAIQDLSRDTDNDSQSQTLNLIWQALLQVKVNGSDAGRPIVRQARNAADNVDAFQHDRTFGLLYAAFGDPEDAMAYFDSALDNRDYSTMQYDLIYLRVFRIMYPDDDRYPGDLTWYEGRVQSLLN